jgi:enamine deaminase RidA (YjgF/YER057c/UK114 family)
VSGRDAAGNVIGRGDIEAQTVAVYESLKETLASAGATSPPASTFIVVVAILADPDSSLRSRA